MFYRDGIDMPRNRMEAFKKCAHNTHTINFTVKLEMNFYGALVLIMC